ncbi:MAG: hypothetical protein K1X89_21115 [Myxococcaceae bacterium]|nr:hypothetical protein [Myxococcaceae bacterium]
MHTDARIAAVLELLEGRTPAEAVAAKAGVSVAELEGWRDAYVAGLKAGAPAQRTRRRRLAAVGATLGLAGVAAWCSIAYAATCTQTLPAPLVTFCANNPAVASDINGNFAALVNFVTSKVGAVGNTNVTITGPLVASGSTTFTGPSVNFATPGSGAGGRAISHDFGNQLSINGQGDFSSVVIGGNTRVNGNLVVQGRRSIDGAASTAYDISLRRYVLDVTPAKVGTVQPIDNSMLSELCMDEDGCDFTIAMLNWDITKNVATRSGHLFYSQVSNAWRTEMPFGAGTETVGYDGDSALQEMPVWDCYLTDAETTTDTNNGRADNGFGLGFLNCRGCTYSDATTTCRLILRD